LDAGLILAAADSTIEQTIRLQTNQLKPSAADGIEEIIEERRRAAQAAIEAMRREATIRASCPSRIRLARRQARAAPIRRRLPVAGNVTEYAPTGPPHEQTCHPA
jgi:hypothetical protein